MLQGKKDSGPCNEIFDIAELLQVLQLTENLRLNEGAEERKVEMQRGVHRLKDRSWIHTPPFFDSPPSTISQSVTLARFNLAPTPYPH